MAKVAETATRARVNEISMLEHKTQPVLPEEVAVDSTFNVHIFQQFNSLVYW